MADYKINDCGVCTNPKVYGEVLHKVMQVAWNKITVAQFPNGKWSFGVWFHFDQLEACGGGFGCNECDAVHETERDAVLAGIAWFKKQIERQEKTQYDRVSIDTSDGGCISKPATTKEMRMCVEKAFNEITQLALF